MPHNQIPVPLRILGKEVQGSQRRLWMERVKGAVLQFWVRKVGLCGHPSPNILAISQAAFGVFPLHGTHLLPLSLGGLHVTVFNSRSV